MFANISELDGSKNWKSLSNELEKKEIIQVKNMAKALMGGAVQNPELVIAYTKGFVAGLKWARSAPKNAQREWTKLSKREDK